MRNPLAILFAVMVLSPPAFAGDSGFAWKPWRSLPVLDGGRHKPLDSLAWETWRIIGNRVSFRDPESGEKLDATALYLAMLLDWQGWDRSPDPHAAHGANPSGAYFRAHQPDKWDRAPLIVVNSPALRSALGLAADQKYIAPLDLGQAKIEEPQSGEPTPFMSWAAKLERNARQGLTTFEREAVELAGRLSAYQGHRMGQHIQLLPVPDSEEQHWLSLAEIAEAKPSERTDPTGAKRKVQEQFRKLRSAYRAGSAEDFNAASAEFLALLRESGPELGEYPLQSAIDLEVGYNHWMPFRFAWAFTLLACLAVLLSMGTGWKPFYVAAWASFVAGLGSMSAGFALRTIIAGRVPVANMYESVIYVGMGVAVFGLLFELIYRRQYVLCAAAAVSTVTLILADNCPALLDPSMRPLQPVLRSNFWLATHVMTITLSYAAFALALGIANISLGYQLAGSEKQELNSALGLFTYRCLQVGVLLLAIGIILGGVWAEQSWGRFWGWDPKEVWALIALLGYLAVLHARYLGWVGQFGLAALSVICFSLVVVAWYGVNFVLGTGLHSYGFGGGGKAYVGAAVLVQFLYVGAAALRIPREGAKPSERRESSEKAEPASIASVGS